MVVCRRSERQAIAQTGKRSRAPTPVNLDDRSEINDVSILLNQLDVMVLTSVMFRIISASPSLFPIASMRLRGVLTT
jgi:hypothetical protein